MLLEDGEEVARAAPPPVDAVDGTAAGDAFTACLLVSLLEGRAARGGAAPRLRRRRARRLALGAQPSLPTAAEVDAISPGDHVASSTATRHGRRVAMLLGRASSTSR